MLLKKNYIPASSIAEVVIAMAAIAACIGISAIVFSRSLMVTHDFETLRKQTAIQSEVWASFQTHGPMQELEGVTVEKKAEDAQSNVDAVTWSLNGKVLWKQQVLRSE